MTEKENRAQMVADYSLLRQMLHLPEDVYIRYIMPSTATSCLIFLGGNVPEGYVTAEFETVEIRTPRFKGWEKTEQLMAKKDEPRFGLIKKCIKHAARDFMDYDYLDKLTEEELQFLDKFSREYYNANFTKNDRKNLHKGKLKKREIYRTDNARRRDVWANMQRIPDWWEEIITSEDEDDNK